MPLVGEALRATPGEVVAEGDLTSAIRELFGLDLPQAAVKALLRRARKADLVSLENRMYHPKRENLEGSRFGEKQAYVLECHARLLDNIASFSREHFQVEISSQQADAALQAFIRDNEFTLISGLPMPSPIPVNGPLNARERFLIASYISYVQEKQTPDLAYLEMVVKGAILSGALYLEVPGQAARNFVDTDVYVDTRCPMFALGLAGPVYQAPYTELLALLKETGARVRCFRHNFDEIHAVLIAIKLLLQKGGVWIGYGRETWEYLIEQKQMGTPDVERIIATLERDLAALGVAVLERPPRDLARREQLLDEAKLSGLIVKYTNYKPTDAGLARDVESVAAIVRLRGSRRSTYVENSGAVFVTSTGGIGRAAEEFFRAEVMRLGAPICTTAEALTNLLWLKPSGDFLRAARSFLSACLCSSPSQ